MTTIRLYLLTVHTHCMNGLYRMTILANHMYQMYLLIALINFDLDLKGKVGSLTGHTLKIFLDLNPIGNGVHSTLF